jgi:hypothetical protein
LVIKISLILVKIRQPTNGLSRRDAYKSAADSAGVREIDRTRDEVGFLLDVRRREGFRGVARAIDVSTGELLRGIEGYFSRVGWSGGRVDGRSNREGMFYWNNLIKKSMITFFQGT